MTAVQKVEPKIIGYWCELPETDPVMRRLQLRDLAHKPDPLPDPRNRVKKLPEQVKRTVVDYLRAAPIVARYRGFSVCRMCGIMNGSAEQSDGVYRWPEGLAHYVDEHSVWLPEFAKWVPTYTGTPWNESAKAPPLAHFYEQVQGYFWFQECYSRLLRTLPDDRPSRFVEIGCFRGRSTCWLGVEIAKSGKPVELNCVDNWKYPTPAEGAASHLAFTENTMPIRQAMGDRFRVFPLDSVGAAECFGDESVDVVFVDGDHSYDAVLADISAWWPKLKVGGFMAGDDFMMSDVCRAVVEQFAPSGYILCHGWTTTPAPLCWPSWLARKAAL